MEDAQEVVALRLMVKDGTLIHLVLQDCDAFEILRIYLTKQRDLFTHFPKDLDSMLAHVSKTLVLSPLDEGLDWESLVRIDVPLHFASHSKVVY